MHTFLIKLKREYKKIILLLIYVKLKLLLLYTFRTFKWLAINNPTQALKFIVVLNKNGIH